MRTLKSIAVAALLITAGTTTSFAQEKEADHHIGKPGMGPHKGTIQEADPYHAEILNKDGKVTFYLLDGDAKPMSNKGVTGSVILQFADKTSATVSLTPMGDDGFSVSNDKASTFTSSVVTFKVNGKSVTAKFKAEKGKSYTCSMCGGTYDKAGKCPKCGMDLVEKKEEHHHNEGDHKH
jgi:rubrerythrin